MPEDENEVIDLVKDAHENAKRMTDSVCSGAYQFVGENDEVFCKSCFAESMLRTAMTFFYLFHSEEKNEDIRDAIFTIIESSEREAELIRAPGPEEGATSH